jgi:hypothetical protein
MQPPKDGIESFSIDGTEPKLVDVVAGTTPRLWYRRLVPELEARGVLRKNGARWYGRRADIERALTEASTASPTTEKRA